MKNLVVYYSRSKNTETAAQEILKAVGGDAKKIELIKDCSFAGAAFKALFGLKGKVKSIDFNVKDYDNIFIGSPVWAGKSSTPINTFLSDVDLAGKNVFVFITQADGKTPYPVYKSIAERVESKGGKVIDSFFIKTDMKNPLTPAQAAEPVSEWINKNSVYLQ
ncbi:flavodoxin [Sedimentibacter hydroxybenzoicus DSM 7310]|uniref:Flavodoxin n=1 Tax=Sedimentibacter hydroxybenzoicus DSM 7310 TaxID=1123245 RepID=A0A974BMM0_SEDHY|nr:flavodoxin [Sedimentibacter hydroxybenzoicus]NYB75365.1 flavodoxin [Sedimentibacter hydroxybenzoicus DSM 7310]